MPDNHTARASGRRSIGARLTRYALGAAILLGLLFSVAGAALDLFDEKARVERRVSQILDTVAPSASRAAFQLNEGMGEEVLSGLFAYEFVRRAEILDDDGRRLAAIGRPLQKGLLSDFSRRVFADIESHTVTLRSGAEATPVGRLTLDLDTYVIAVGVIKRTTVAVVAGIVWSGLFAVLLLYIFHVSLTKPLKSLVDRFRAVDHDAPEKRQFTLPKGHEQDELGLLVHTINDYFARLDVVQHRLGATEERYRGLFENTEVPMLNADISAVAPTFSRLRQEGVSDLRKHLAANRVLCGELISGIRITRANKAALALFKAETEDALIHGLNRILPPKDASLPVDALCAFWNRQDVFRSESGFRTLDGQEINAIVSFRLPESQFDLQNVPVSIIDITKMKKAERELHENFQRIEMTLTANNAGAWSWDMNTNKTMWSDENYRLLGYRPGEVEANYDTWFLRVHPDDREFATEQVSTAVAEKSKLDFEYRAVMPDGSIRWLQDIGSVIEDADGTVLGMYGVQIDRTNRKNLEAQLAQSQKMEAVGHLTGGVAHDFNNLLQVIQGNLDLALESCADDRTADHLHKVLRAAQRGAGLTQQLLAFSRKQTLTPEIMNPNDVVGGMLELLRRTLGENIEIEASFEDEIPAINVDSNNFQNAVINVAINAKAAMARGGTLSIATRKNRISKPVPVEGGELQAGDYVEISVTDSGCGMSRETLEHAFEPFYTTKDVGEGSGLGLSMVYGFVRQSGGTVTLASKVDKGTTVTLLFPVAKKGAPRKKKRPVSAPPERGHGKILVVEDDPDVRSTVMDLLTNRGYEAREAGDALEALEIITSDGTIDVLFSDIMMPKGMSGLELAEKAVSINKNLRVLLTSGYPDAKPGNSGLVESGLELLRKPYSNETLFEKLNAVLTQDGPAGPGD